MNEPPPTDEELATQARECSFIRGALDTGDQDVIDRAMKLHPPSKCSHVAAPDDAA
jgi:hypothetical protein